MSATEPSFVVWRRSSRSGQNGNCVEVASWRKSSRSGQNGACVEVAAWRKSSRSGQNGGCVEVAPLGSTFVGVRDSKDRGGPHLAVVAENWDTFIASVKARRFDLD